MSRYEQFELFELADAIRETAKRIVDGELVNTEDKLDLAEQMWEARRRLSADREYGAWWRSTGIEYSRKWRSVLVRAGKRIFHDGRPGMKSLHTGGEFSIERFARTGEGWVTGGDDAPFDSAYSGQENWFTPAWVFEGLGLVFDLDVAAPPGGVPWIPARRYFTEDDDGLTQPWTGVVWCNPPYSAPTEWCRRFAAHDQMALLIRADLSTGGPLAALAAADALWVPDGRLQFVDGAGDRGGAVTFSTVLLGRGVTVVEAMDQLARLSGLTRVLT